MRLIRLLAAMVAGAATLSCLAVGPDGCAFGRRIVMTCSLSLEPDM